MHRRTQQREVSGSSMEQVAADAAPGPVPGHKQLGQVALRQQGDPLEAIRRLLHQEKAQSLPQAASEDGVNPQAAADAAPALQPASPAAGLTHSPGQLQPAAQAVYELAQQHKVAAEPARDSSTLAPHAELVCSLRQAPECWLAGRRSHQPGSQAAATQQASMLCLAACT